MDSASPTDIPSQTKPKPAGLREFSPRAILCGFFVAGLMGASYPYVVLKLGFGPNVSVVAAILGYVILGLIFVPLLRLLGLQPTPYNRWENNIVQTAGTAAAQTAFMCILLAAFDMLKESGTLSVSLTPLQSFAWLSTAGLLGVLLAVPLRQHFIVDEKLPFADGLAAGETILVCDSEGPTAFHAAVAMLAGIAASATLKLFHDDAHVFQLVPSMIGIGTAVMAITGFGIETSLLSIGSGMIIGMRINVNMLVGALLSWVLAPYALDAAGILPAGFNKFDVLKWVMWPATGLLVAGGLTTLLLRWQILVRTFRNLSAGTGADEFPLRWVVIGSLASGTALIVVQEVMFGQPFWVTLLAILLSVPLALVGLRVLGETNWGPISSLSNMMQGIFAFVVPGNIPANMMASGTTGTIAVESEAIMQDYKAGDMVGSSPRYLTYMQLLATPVGAATVAWMYPFLRDFYGFRKGGLSSPISRRWQAFAELLAQGADALPQGAVQALVVGSLAGILLAVLESRVKNRTWVPSATGLGIGMLVPAASVVTMFLGGLVGLVWSKVSPKTSELLSVPLASGLIAGEALVAVLVPLLVILGLVK